MQLCGCYELYGPTVMLMHFYRSVKIFLLSALFTCFCLRRSCPCPQSGDGHLQPAQSVHRTGWSNNCMRQNSREGEWRRRRRWERLSCVSSHILSQYSSLWGGEERRDRQHFLSLTGAGEGLSRVQRGGAMMHCKNLRRFMLVVMTAGIWTDPKNIPKDVKGRTY